MQDEHLHPSVRLRRVEHVRSSCDPRHGERQLVVGGDEDEVAERLEARSKEVDVGGHVVEEVRDVLLVDVANAVLLDAR